MNYFMRLRKIESDFKNYVQKVSVTILNENGTTSLTKFKHSVLSRKLVSHHGFDFNLTLSNQGGGAKYDPPSATILKRLKVSSWNFLTFL